MSHSILCGVLLLCFIISSVHSVCPHCFGNFASCDYATTKKCPSVDDVTTNAAVILAGVGSLTLKNVLKNRYLRLFTRFAWDTFVILAKRPEPGAMFQVKVTSTAPELLAAITHQQITTEMVMVDMAALKEGQSAEVKEVLTDRMTTIKNVQELRIKMGQHTMEDRHDSGTNSFLLAKVSEFVVKGAMKLRLTSEADSSGSSLTHSLVAKIHAPEDCHQFYMIINLYIMYSHAIGMANCLVMVDFFLSASPRRSTLSASQ